MTNLVLGIWIACALGALRPAIRFFIDDLGADDWPTLLSAIAFAVFFSGVFGPFIAAAALFNFAIAQRFDAKAAARALEGTPRGERMEARMRELESRNAALERELGIG